MRFVSVFKYAKLKGISTQAVYGLIRRKSITFKKQRKIKYVFMVGIEDATDYK